MARDRIHEDWTDRGILSKLLERGIERSKIVLGFIPEYERNDPQSIRA